MTKTKAQLRAEAVERLKSNKPYSYKTLVAEAVRGISGMCSTNALIELLTDDECDQPCYTCSRLAELVAENGQLRARIENQRQVSDLRKQSKTPNFDNNVIDNDSREKLEADVHRRWKTLPQNEKDTLRWLDRQADITHEETLRYSAIGAREAGKLLREQNAELQAKVDELTAENADLRGKLLEVATIAAWPLADLDGTSVVDIEGNVIS